MSTSYYAPREGYHITKNDGAYVWFLLYGDTWVATVNHQYLQVVVDRNRKVAERVNGAILMHPDAAGLPDTEWVVSEYGEPVTVGDLRRGVAP